MRESGGEVISFKVKNSTKMLKVYKAYADRKGVGMGTFRLVTADGVNIQQDQSIIHSFFIIISFCLLFLLPLMQQTKIAPKALGFEDEEVVDVLAAQVGGGCF